MGLHTILIREESAADRTLIHSLTEQAFRGADHSTHTEQFITDALRTTGQLTLSLVAVEEDEVVGHVAISPVELSDGTANWFGLGPVAVLPAWQRRGIGSQMIRRALEMLRERGASGIVVLGEPRYYRRFGFLEVPSLILPDVPPEYFQGLAFAGKIPAATVKYHDSFGEADQLHSALPG